MKTITIKQPYASLICEGIKDIENRSWPTKYRGSILIHAALKPVKLTFEMPGQATAQEITMSSFLNSAEENNLFGCIIGSVYITDCVKGHNSKWAIKDNYHWVLAYPILFPEPIYTKGKLSFWDYPNIHSEPEEENGELFCNCQIPVKEQNQVYSLIDNFCCRYCLGKWYK